MIVVAFGLVAGFIAACVWLATWFLAVVIAGAIGLARGATYMYKRLRS